MMNITSPGSSRPAGRRLGGHLATALVALAALALLLAGTASAKQITPYKFDRFFNGADSTAGPMTTGVKRVEINQSNGRVYVLEDRSNDILISQFNAAGQAQLWSGLGGVSSLTAGGGFNSEMAFDNTGHGGGLYVMGSMDNKSLRAFNEDGTVRIPSFGFTGNRCAIAVGPGGIVWYGSSQWAYRYDPDTGLELLGGSRLFEQQTCKVLFDSNDYVYLSKNFGGGGIYKYVKEPELEAYENTWEGFGDHSKHRFSYVNTPDAEIDPSTNHIFAIESGTKVTEYTDEGQPVTSFGLPEGTYNGLLQATGVAVNETTHEVYVVNKRSGVQAGESPVSPRIDVFKPQAAITVPDATTESPGHPSKTTAVFKGVVNADGVATTQCKFEWGTTTQYTGGSVPCDQGDVFGGSTDNDVTFEQKSLTVGAEYHYRVAAKNANEQWSYGVDRKFEASIAPEATAVIVDRVNTDGARFSAAVNPNGGTTEYHFLVGLDDCSSNPCTVVPGDTAALESKLETESISGTATGLTPDTEYHVQLVAENGAGKVVVPYVFRTYAAPPSDDPCPNAHVRQQTSTSLLLDCRAYELVSAANAGGYDVESDLVPGHVPFVSYPDADDRALYGLHFGSVPGVAGSPTNHGLDPYVSERGAGGWTTRYVGIPADGMTDDTPFGSPLLASDAALRTFAFGGPDICDPCYPDGSTNVPLRLSDGTLVKGMAGSSNPAADPAGEVRKPLSKDGSHFVFGSTSKFEDAGNSGSVSIYDRNLQGGGTQVVSTMPDGTTMTGDVAQLDISSDGNRILVGKLVGTDAGGNELFDLYMHIGAQDESVQVADTPGGVQFSGMTSDGSMVFFSTGDPIAGDSDSSVDIFRADVGTSTAAVSRVSTGTGGTGNTDACEPDGFPESWNAVTGDGDCNVVAFAGGAGVGAEDGTFYFASPERLDGGGIDDQANLYFVKPGGQPQFVETIDTSIGTEPPAPLHPLITADFTGESHSAPEAVAVDQDSGDLYVYETGNGKVARYTSTGAADNFSAVQPYIEGNRITGLPTAGNSGSQIAIDNAASSPLDGSVYVTSGTTVSAFAQSGEKVGSITGSENAAGSFATACGVATDPSDGTLYIADRAFEVIWKYTPKAGAATPIDDADYEVEGLIVPGFATCNVAADDAGHLYASRFSNGPVRAFETAAFEAPFAIGGGTQFNAVSRSVAVDPSNGDVYVNEASQIVVFNSALEQIQTVGTGEITGSRGVAVHGGTHHVYAPTGLNIAKFGHELAPYHPIDHPGVINGVLDADTHRTSDFQVSLNGRYAVFTSRLSLTGFANLGHSEIYRHDSVADEVECASCATTGAAAKSDTVLAPYGLNVSEDGRVFFTSEEGLVLADTNEKRDAYQWSGGSTIGQISTGRSLDDSSLLTASRDGKNVFFFTRDILVPSDENGGAVKIYTAREGGGYKQTTTPLPCAASDECHGPGTKAPPPPNINSITGAGEEGEITPETSCAALERRAKKSKARAAQLRRRAAKAEGPRAKALRGNARRAAKKANRLGRRATACKRSSGGNG